MRTDRKVLEDQVTSSIALLLSVDELASSGIKNDLHKVQSGQVLLSKWNSALTNSALTEALQELEEFHKVQKKL